jgi:DNA-binding MarR family transcriptional regulator
MSPEVDKARATARLQQLSEEVGRIANVLAALSEHEAAAAAMAAVGGPAHGEEGPLDSGFIRSIIRVRRLRDHFFKSDLFSDPAWDMLLDLMAARVEGRQVAVSSLCIAAAVPPTTALRWIKSLCDQGLFVRIADPEDGRRVFIELSGETAARMEAYLRSAQRVGTIIT